MESAIEEGKEALKSASLSEQESAILEMMGYHTPVNEKDYQIANPLHRATQATTAKAPVGATTVFDTGERYEEVKELVNTPPEKRGYVPHMSIHPEQQQEDLPQMVLGEQASAPQDYSSKTLAQGDKAASVLATELLLEKGYPLLVYEFSKCRLSPYANKDLPYKLRKELQDEVDAHNRRVENNSHLDPETIKEFRDSLTAVLDKYRVNRAVGPEWQLAVVSGQIVITCVRTIQENAKDREMMEERINASIDRAVKEIRAEREALRREREAFERDKQAAEAKQVA